MATPPEPNWRGIALAIGDLYTTINNLQAQLADAHGCILELEAQLQEQHEQAAGET